jgi:hypothetical protein
MDRRSSNKDSRSTAARIPQLLPATGGATLPAGVISSHSQVFLLPGYHNYSQLQEELHSLQESYPHIAGYFCCQDTTTTPSYRRSYTPCRSRILTSSGISVARIPQLLPATGGATFPVGVISSHSQVFLLPGYHNYSQLQEELHSLQESYPHIARYFCCQDTTTTPS